MKTDKEILQQFASEIVPELKAVSKRFAPSIESVIDETSVTIYASPYIRTLIDGRGPTRANAPKGNPTLQQIIRKWIDERSISPRPNAAGKIPTLDQLSWAISKSIHAHGDLLYQRGGGNNIFESILTDSRIDNLLNLFGQKYFIEIQKIKIK